MTPVPPLHTGYPGFRLYRIPDCVSPFMAFIRRSLRGVFSPLLIGSMSLFLSLLLPFAAVAGDHAGNEHNDLLGSHLDALMKGRPGITDLYFVGIAPYSTEDVFMNETSYVRNMFDLQYGTAGRSLLLVNNSKTSGLYPPVTMKNLERTFRGIGRLMQSGEDMLVLFITSHGDEGKGIRLQAKGVDNVSLSRKYLDAESIRRFFEENNIRWRVIILSACFSGGLMDRLENEYSLIITSASSERPSFGCGHHGDFTWFGDTFFRKNLSANPDFISAFWSARQDIRELEEKMGITASNPQIHVGSEIRPMLEKLADRVSVP